MGSKRRSGAARPRPQGGATLMQHARRSGRAGVARGAPLEGGWCRGTACRSVDEEPDQDQDKSRNTK
ncbi:hypothetical protein CBM2592_B60013 [Cupriavidus taiwanensis]|nr:hypothetical protein CBM2588_B40291 [Cupriavidus taiwanensis]SOY72424.1 hypothetical protein CBM2592_B60013 [Cupriavidus taiwanensis]SOZ30671.1 hypothetical protein CBM2608_B40007 [Cupriavidus taiwanensis]SOZ75236.1 hypothetical protein CBM2617_B80013 [Cupriavidus taiwanensis]SOZ88956.1 hypothetical protein CBM2618_B70014 [Cupriavidus taiwanensis]